MRSFVKYIGVVDRANNVHGLKFGPGVNVVTGRSSTGKSALIEIVDFCFGSSDFTIPDGIITQSAKTYFVVLGIQDIFLVLARRDKETTAFLKVESEEEVLSDIQSFKEEYFEDHYFSPLAHFKKQLGGYFGLNISDVDENLTEREYRGKKKTPPSIRSFTSFMLQHQNLVANKHAIFYRFDEKEKREQAIDHFKIFAGFADQQYFLKAQEMADLKQTQRGLEQQIPRAAVLRDKAKASLQEAVVRFRSASGKDLKLGDMNDVVIKPKPALDYLAALPLSIDDTSDQHLQVRNQLEKERAAMVAQLRKDQLKLSSAESSMRYALNYSEDVEATLFPDHAGIAESKCPFCNVAHGDIKDDANRLSQAIEWLNGELSKSSYILTTFEAETAELTKVVRKQAGEVDEVSRKIAEIDAQIDNLANHKSLYEIALKEKVRIEAILESLLEKSDAELEKQLTEIKVKISEIASYLKRTYDVEKKLKDAEGRIKEIMHEIANRFEFERTYRPISLNFSLETFDLWHEAKAKKVFLRSMGSGANWLYCHVTLFLALHRYFCEIGESCLIPSILFLDQPSQVYFPSVLDTGKKFLPKELAEKAGESHAKTVDEDIVAVANLYSQLVAFCKETKEQTGIEPQIIVTDHADHLQIEGNCTFEELVGGRRWRGEAEGFINTEIAPPPEEFPLLL